MLRIEKRLIIRMPAHRLFPILVEVGVARVGELFQPTNLTDRICQLQEPGRHLHARPRGATVAVRAGAALGSQPAGASRKQLAIHLRPLPVEVGSQSLEPPRQLLPGEGIGPVRHEAPASRVAKNRNPSAPSATSLSYGSQDASMSQWLLLQALFGDHLYRRPLAGSPS